jgi:hypothetical protein
MGVKDFLRPNRIIIVLFLVILVIMSILPIVGVSVYVFCEIGSGPCGHPTYYIPLYSIITGERLGFEYYFSYFSIIIIALQIIISYLISCMITKFYHRNKTKPAADPGTSESA